MNLNAITHAYKIAALWSSTDDEGEPLDREFDLKDIDPQTAQAMREDVAKFVKQAKLYIVDAGLDDDQIGHDFWLTRNRHGAGFWDRGLGAVGDKLTTIAHSFGEVWLYIGDDQKIHA